MPQLYAVCRVAEALSVKRVLLENDLQDEVESIFRAQENQFLEGVDAEIAFTGSWRPDPDEILTVSNLPDALALRDAINQNAVGLEEVDANNFDQEGIKGLVLTTGQNQNRRALVQSFSPQQILAKKFSFLLRDGVFQKLQEPGFSLDNKLVAIVDGSGTLKFKTYHLVRRIFDLNTIYRDATDAEIKTFCALACLTVADANEFVANSDEGIRKLIHAVTAEDVLANYTVAQIRSRARAIGFSVTTRSGSLVVPDGRKARKAFLSFLLNKVYQGPIDKSLFITNSNRRLGD